MKKIFLLTALLCMGIAASAQDFKNEDEKDTTAKPIPPAVENLRLAFDLSRYGYANKNAVSLITAAQILNQNGFELEELDAEKLLEDARTFAKDNPHLLALIDMSDTGPVRGALGEEKYSLDMVKSYATDTYKVKFKENKKAVVQVKGVGLTDLDLYIYDKNGNLVTSDTSDSDNCECTWVPKWTGEFTIRIKNRGGLYNLYYMQTN
ncbi:MAG: hypothetical protein J5882_01290 [Bacteroidales bacterium]|nr:hypothetical protein [Bacteroidales bacterium]